MSTPTLTVLTGGGDHARERFNREWGDAWSQIAAACEEGLTHLDPQHPLMDEFEALRAKAWRIATGPVA